MDLQTLNRLFPNGKYVKIARYDDSAWVGMEYNSKYDQKRPLTVWKDHPLSYEEAESLANDGWRIGWVVPEGYCCVDIDNEDSTESSSVVERILADNGVKCCYNRSSRGVHFIFEDPTFAIPSDAVTKCALGITVDHRANGKGYIILPVNDPHRSWGIWETPDPIPYYLKPIVPAKGQIETFIGMNQGDGRNTELFKWRTKLLTSNKLSDEEITESLRLINQYEFIVPLSDDEMKRSVLKARATDSLARESSGRKTANALEKDNIFNAVAEKIVQAYDLMCIGYKQFYRFEGSYYKPLREIDVERMIHYEISQNISSSGRKEIMQFLGLKTLVEPAQLNNKWQKIAVGNGVLDIATGEVSSPIREECNTIGIEWNYNPDPTYSPKIDEFMNHLSANKDGSVNNDKKNFLYQVAGYCLLKKNYFSKFFIFQGGGGTGKSTFQDVIVKMVGEVNRSRVSIDKMDNDYYLATTLNKLVNIDDDAVDGKALENSGRFKSLTSGNEITVRQIFQEPVTFTPFATCMFSCNKLPRILDRTSGLYRRLIIVELNNKVENPNPTFVQDLTTADMEYFLYNAVKWIGIALRENRFRISQSESELLRKFKCRQSSLNEWLFEDNMALRDIYKKPVQSLYAIYVEWAQRNGYQKLPSILTFKEDIETLYDVKIGYNGEERRESQQIFIRDGIPTEDELMEVPF